MVVGGSEMAIYGNRSPTIVYRVYEVSVFFLFFFSFSFAFRLLDFIREVRFTAWQVMM